MNKPTFKPLPMFGVLLALLGAAAIFTGLFKEEKSFYAIAAVCLSISVIFLFLGNRSNVRPGQ